MNKFFYKLFTKSKYTLLALVITIFFINSSFASNEPTCYSSMHEVLECFIQHNDLAYSYSLENLPKNTISPNDVTVETYSLHSQKWPVNNYIDIPTTTWKHRLIFYIPSKILHTKALLYVNGGRNINLQGEEELLNPKESLNFAEIAQNSQAVVVELQDVPNQFLFFNNVAKKEDQILAYTYTKFMEDPERNAYLPGHLPMTKAVIKAMDATQKILQQKHSCIIDGFVLSGASKRGWAVWLTTLIDKRVEAIIPIVINMLNTQKSMIHTCNSYGGTCPPALRDYEEQNITHHLATENFSKLMEIEDPYSYLNIKKYQTRLSIPKYIINASGDDFFVPDSAKLYFDKLPGDNYLRYLPNAMHYFAGNPISDATDSLHKINHSVSTYFSFFLNKTPLPKVSWNFKNSQLNITTSLEPKEVRLWVAHNPQTRDFRYLNSYSKWHLFVKKAYSFFTKNLCDNCYIENLVNFACEKTKPCEIEVSLPVNTEGWQAVFAELHYDINGTDFIITTDVNITPDITPETLAKNHVEL